MRDPLPTQHAKIIQSFKRSLSGYHENAVVQADIAKTLMDHFLRTAERQTFSNVFEFGCSTGHLTEQLISRLDIGALTANDLIEESQDCLSSITRKASLNLQFLSGAIEALELPEHLDLIASSSTLQWIDDMPTLVDKLTNALQPGGWLMLSTFAEHHFSELQAIGSKAKAPSYMNAENLSALCPDNLAVKFIDTQDIKIHFKSARAMLSHLRQTGVNGNAGQPWTRQKLLDFETEYEARFKDDTGIPLTYAPIYFIAQKKA